MRHEIHGIQTFLTNWVPVHKMPEAPSTCRLVPTPFPDLSKDTNLIVQ